MKYEIEIDFHPSYDRPLPDGTYDDLCESIVVSTKPTREQALELFESEYGPCNVVTSIKLSIIHSEDRDIAFCDDDIEWEVGNE